MDEIYGYLPPTANPPSKKPLMTMLKQARAFGLGILLATQNPVDLDYKALSNIGAWFLGRLQTERDKMRVLDGLEGAAASQEAGFDRRKMEETLAGLGERVFLLNNVHEDGPVTFHVRWVLSYLCGPMARAQIKQLMDPKRGQFEEVELKKKDIVEKGPTPPPLPPAAADKPEQGAETVHGSVSQFYVPVSSGYLDKQIVYMPAAIRSAEVQFSEASYDIFGTREFTNISRIWPDEVSINWSESVPLPEGMNTTHLRGQPLNPVEFGALPEFAKSTQTFTAAKRDYADWLYQNQSLPVLHAEAFGMYAKLGETEGEFRARLSHRARELRDQAIEDIQQKFAKQMDSLEDKLEDAEKDVAEQRRQATSAGMGALVRIGGTLLTAILSKRARIATATNARTATSSGSKAWKESRDVATAKKEVRAIEDDLRELESELERAIEDIKKNFDPDRAELKTVDVKPLKKNINVTACGLVWLPFIKRGRMELEKAWV